MISTVSVLAQTFLIVLRMRGGQVDEMRAEELERTLEAKLQGYEIILSRQKYLAGNVGPKINSQYKLS